MNNFTIIVVVASRSGTPPMAAENLQNLDGRVKSLSNNQLQASIQTLQACAPIAPISVVSSSGILKWSDVLIVVGDCLVNCWFITYTTTGNEDPDKCLVGSERFVGIESSTLDFESNGIVRESDEGFQPGQNLRHVIAQQWICFKSIPNTVSILL